MGRAVGRETLSGERQFSRSAENYGKIGIVDFAVSSMDYEIASQKCVIGILQCPVNKFHFGVLLIKFVKLLLH